MLPHLENDDAQNARHKPENHDEVEIALTSGVQAEASQNAEPRRLAAGQWLRVMTGFSAPFGHDGMPTVWG